MKRIKAACICQTLAFVPKEDTPGELAAKYVQEEIARYKKTLERNRVRYRILEETVQPDSSAILKIIKQYSASPVGDYLN